MRIILFLTKISTQETGKKFTVRLFLQGKNIFCEIVFTFSNLKYSSVAVEAVRRLP